MKMNKPLVQSFIASVLSIALLVALLLAMPAYAASPTAPRPTTTSFHFNDIPVRSALQLIAEEGQFNLVVSDSVKGNITLRLEDVTWEQAFAIVLRMKGLGSRVDGTHTVTVSGG